MLTIGGEGPGESVRGSGSTRTSSRMYILRPRCGQVAALPQLACSSTIAGAVITWLPGSKRIRVDVVRDLIVATLVETSRANIKPHLGDAWVNSDSA